MEKAKLFTELHIKGNPIILCNAWDVGSAKAILEAGSKVVATSSWAVAQTQGYEDGESIPFGTVKSIVRCIVTSVDACHIGF